MKHIITAIVLALLTSSIHAGDVGRYQLYAVTAEFSSSDGSETKITDHKDLFLIDTVTGRTWKYEWWNVKGAEFTPPYWGEEIKLHSGVSIQ